MVSLKQFNMDLVLIVEGHCEYDSMPAITSKIPNAPHYIPILNAGGIGNIVKNTGSLLLDVIKLHSPKKIIITLDYRDALKEKIVESCVQLKMIVKNNCNDFLDKQKSGSLTLPEIIEVIVIDKTFESWICADYESLKQNELFNGNLITETFTNVDIEIENPNAWLKSKLKDNIDIKSRRNRVNIYKKMNAEFAKEKSRSFRKFYKEVENSSNDTTLE